MAKERYSVERNDVEDERKGCLERNPKRVIGANKCVDYGYVKFRSSSVVAKKAISRVAEPHQGE